jgi:hypothetical protein
MTHHPGWTDENWSEAMDELYHNNDERRFLRRLTIGFLAFLVLMLTAITAFAAGLPIGVAMPMETMACDTEEQAMSIIAAHKQGGYDASFARAKQLQQERNSVNEPKCGRVAGVMMVSEPSWQQVLDFPKGQRQVSVARLIMVSQKTKKVVTFVGVFVLPAVEQTSI